VFNYGCLRRKVGHTGLNDVSSRSHGVLMISVSSDDGNPDMPLVGKLNLIDLAGNKTYPLFLCPFTAHLYSSARYTFGIKTIIHVMDL
jgi:hypothetical protein